jgi:hypothetical protein
MTGYVLAPDAPAALRDTGAASAAALRKQAGSGNKWVYLRGHGAVHQHIELRPCTLIPRLNAAHVGA